MQFVAYIKEMLYLCTEKRCFNPNMVMSIDIILITYNQEQFVQQAIDGILIQRIAADVKLRIIVADDSSTDKTLEVIKTGLGEGKVVLDNGAEAGIVYLPIEMNMGHVRNYQRAFAVTDADYVAIIEGDDYWVSPLHLQNHIDFLDIHRECVLTNQLPIMYYEEEKRFEPMVADYICQKSYKIISTFDELNGNRVANLSSCVIRGNILHKLDDHIFTCSILDWPMYVNLSQLGILCIIPGSTVVYRIKKTGIYAGLSEQEQYQEDVKYLSEMEKVFPQYSNILAETKSHLVVEKKKTGQFIIKILLMPFVYLVRFLKKIKKVYRQIA